MLRLDCAHETEAGLSRVCQHLLNDRSLSYRRRFTGKGLTFDLVCSACREAEDLRVVCADCATAVERDSQGDMLGFDREPELLIRPSTLRLRHRVVTAALEHNILDIQALEGDDHQQWIAWAEDGRLYRLDLDNGASVSLTPSLSRNEEDTLRLSPDGRFAAVFERRGRRGFVVDLHTGTVTMSLDRGGYHEDVCNFSVAFCVYEGWTLLIHATDWNRLDISDPLTGELLTIRETPHHRQPHYLDYFHASLTPSPDYEHIVDDGWIWHPMGAPRVWSLRRWLKDNVWESEDGESVKDLCGRVWFWDGPCCWLDNRRLALWGQGNDVENLIATARIFEVTTGKEERCFAGPKGDFYYVDGMLCSCDKDAGMSVWDSATGERLLWDSDTRPTRYHRSAKSFLTQLSDGSLRLTKLVGQPMPAAWRTANVLHLAEGIASERSFTDLPILADALEDAGCNDAEILSHCRAATPHGCECWVLDRILA